MRGAVTSLIVVLLLGSFPAQPARAHAGAPSPDRRGADSVPIRPPSRELMEGLTRPPHGIQEWKARDEERGGQPTEVWYQDGRERLRIDRR